MRYTPKEKMGGDNKRISRVMKFMDMLDSCGLRALRYRGPAFFWNNKRSSPFQIHEHLDRTKAITDYFNLFSVKVVWHLDFFCPDHRLLRIVINDQELAELR